MLAVPRVALLVLPWAWSLSSGRWANRLLEGESWHHVRYAAPFVAIAIAAGVVGFARWRSPATGSPIAGEGWRPAGRWLRRWPRAGRWRGWRSPRSSRPLRRFGRAEAEVLWSWIDRVPPGDGVLADYRVAAPLSSRPNLRSFILFDERPAGYPTLAPDFKWAFVPPKSEPEEVWRDQGFEPVYRGETITVYHRTAGGVEPYRGGVMRPSFRPWFHPIDLTDSSWRRSALAPLALRGRGSDGVVAGRVSRARGRPRLIPDAEVFVTAEPPIDLADPVARRREALRDDRGLGDARLGHARAIRVGAFPAGEPARRDRLGGPRPPGAGDRSQARDRVGLLSSAVGVATGCPTILDGGLRCFFAASAAPLLILPLEIVACERGRPGPGGWGPPAPRRPPLAARGRGPAAPLAAGGVRAASPPIGERSAGHSNGDGRGRTIWPGGRGRLEYPSIQSPVGRAASETERPDHGEVTAAQDRPRRPLPGRVG